MNINDVKSADKNSNNQRLVYVVKDQFGTEVCFATSLEQADSFCSSQQGGSFRTSMFLMDNAINSDHPFFFKSTRLANSNRIYIVKYDFVTEVYYASSLKSAKAFCESRKDSHYQIDSYPMDRKIDLRHKITYYSSDAIIDGKNYRAYEAAI